MGPKSMAGMTQTWLKSLPVMSNVNISAMSDGWHAGPAEDD